MVHNGLRQICEPCSRSGDGEQFKNHLTWYGVATALSLMAVLGAAACLMIYWFMGTLPRVSPRNF